MAAQKRTQHESENTAPNLPFAVGADAHDLLDDEMATRLAWRVHDSIRRPVRVRGASLEVEVGASIGIAMFAPGGAESLDHLKRVADERKARVGQIGHQKQAEETRNASRRSILLLQLFRPR